VNCCDAASAILGLVGVTDIDTSVAEVTASEVDPDILPDVAVIVVEPAATDVALPLEPAALLMAATVVDDDFQVTDVVTFCVELSEYVPVAVNCLDVPKAMLGLVGVSAMETSVAGVTVSVAVPETLPDVAVIVDEPAATDVALPLEPAVLLMAATAAVDEFHITVVVRSCVVLSEYVPVAVNCCVVPGAMLGLVGSTAMDTSVAEVAVSEVASDMLPEVAVIVVEPAATEVANPLEPAALLMAATAVVEELHVTVVVTSCVVLSENVPEATNCWFEPLTMLGLVGVIAMDTSVAEVTVTIVDPVMCPHVASILALPCFVAFVHPEL